MHSPQSIPHKAQIAMPTKDLGDSLPNSCLTTVQYFTPHRRVHHGVRKGQDTYKDLVAFALISNQCIAYLRL